MKFGRTIPLLFVCAGVFIFPNDAFAQSESFDIKVEATDAVTALNILALQTKHPLLFNYDQVKTVRVNALQGRYTLQQALDLILKGTELSGNLSEGEIISISHNNRITNQNKDEEMTLKETKKLLLGGASAAMIAAAAATPALAQSSDPIKDEIISVGTRSAKPRTATDSPVPIDSLSAEAFNALGGAADITDNLKTLIPSYTATPATGDGSAFVRTTSLRGVAPDQTLVLINGKRRHRSSLIQFFAPAAGQGAHAPDVAMIPSIALKQVEVLRDGAAAQYGSDAIGGVINFVTRTAPEGGEITVQYGQHYEGEQNYKLGANIGVPIGDSGFLNVSAEYIDNEALSRGIQRPVAQALIDAGAVGVGSDSPFGDAPFVQTWGRPETSGLRLFANAGYDINATTEIYAFGNLAETDGRYRFFYRAPNHGTLNTLVATDGYTGALLETGYTPFLDGAQSDTSIVVGLRGETESGWNYDFSASRGENELDYFLNNTVNPTLGLGPDGEPLQRDFNVGSLAQKEVNFNADFSKAIKDNLNFAFGGEWRKETYTTTPGEVSSFTGAGTSGFTSPTPDNSGAFSRDNVAVYVDVEHDISDAVLLQYAARFEDFSDFGSTLNWKVAGRVHVSDALTFRGAVSTGFHAPTPGQTNIQSIITTFDGTTGAQIEEGLVPSTSAAAAAAGGAPLKEETSTNFSIGSALNLFGNTTLTVDLYKINVRDRIYRTGNIVPVGAPAGTSISFYTNALDVDHKGIDVVLTSKFDLGETMSTDLTFSMNINDVEIVNQNLVNGIQPVSDASVEDIENNFPNFRAVLSANTHFGEKWNLLTRANLYGSHFDERGRIGAAVNPTAEIDSIIYFDAELGYKVNEQVTLAFGGTNIFDSFIDEIGAPNANRLSVGLQYPRRTAANYEGGSWYVRAKYNF